MLYFAYGSNLNHFQMKRRCKDSVYLKKINLKEFRLTFRSKYRAADIEKKKNYSVTGGLYEISRSDEKKLDIYEDFPLLYKKMYFTHYGKKIMTFIKYFLLVFFQLIFSKLALLVTKSFCAEISCSSSARER